MKEVKGKGMVNGHSNSQKSVRPSRSRPNEFKKKKWKKKPKGKGNIPPNKEAKQIPNSESKKSYSSNWEAFLKEKKLESKPKETKLDKDGQTSKQKRKAGKKRKFSKVTQSDRQAKTENNDFIDEKEIWFDDVDVEEIEHATGKKVKLSDNSNKTLIKEKEQLLPHDTQDKTAPRITKYLAIDCEMVGVGIDGKDSMLARVSMVNSFGETVYDKFVAPMQKVVDYRTEVSGVRPEDLKGAPDFKDVQTEIASLTKNKILVGHAIFHDLKVLLLSHPRRDIRDTSTYKPFKKLLQTRYPSLKKLTKEILQIDIQSGEHSSVEDARCTMKVFQLHRKKWEKSLKEKGRKETISLTPKIFMGKDKGNDSKTFRKRKYRDRKKKKQSKEQE